MPKVRRMDDSQGHTEQQTPQGMCEPASFLDAGTLRRDSPWPFKWTLQDNRWYVNKARRVRQTPKNNYEEALW